jgi:hypothetical protein
MQSSKEPIPYKISKSVGSTLHNNLLFITHTAFLVCDGDDLRVQDNHLISWYEKRENVTGINILP